MTPLEQTIINAAREELVSVKDFYMERDLALPVGERRENFHRHVHALHVLLKLGRQADNGMSSEAIQALSAIEQEHGAAFTALVASKPEAFAALVAAQSTHPKNTND